MIACNCLDMGGSHDSLERVPATLLLKDQTRGWRMPLKNGVVLLLGQGGVNSVLQRRQNCNILEYSNHCLSLWGIILFSVCLLTYTLLLLSYISHLKSSDNRTLFQLSMLEISFILVQYYVLCQLPSTGLETAARPLRHYQTALF